MPKEYIVRSTILKVLVLFSIGISIPHTVLAETGTAQSSISQLLTKVKESKGDARRRAMNALKLKLRTVNAATRTKTMQELRHAFARAHGQHGSGMHGMQHIPHRQMQQKMNQQHQMNVPHHTKHGQRLPNHRPGMPQRPPSGGHP
jgi:hypothetical protein